MDKPTCAQLIEFHGQLLVPNSCSDSVVVVLFDVAVPIPMLYGYFVDSYSGKVVFAEVFGPS
jgi:hypothetical protein